MFAQNSYFILAQVFLFQSLEHWIISTYEVTKLRTFKTEHNWISYVQDRRPKPYKDNFGSNEILYFGTGDTYVLYILELLSVYHFQRGKKGPPIAEKLR